MLVVTRSKLVIYVKIENEYGAERTALGAAGASYINWAAKMAVGLKTGVPWVMCKEDDAPDPIVSSLKLTGLNII